MASAPIDDDLQRNFQTTGCQTANSGTNPATRMVPLLNWQLERSLALNLLKLSKAASNKKSSATQTSLHLSNRLASVNPQ